MLAFARGSWLWRRVIACGCDENGTHGTCSSGVVGRKIVESNSFTGRNKDLGGFTWFTLSRFEDSFRLF